LILRARRLLTRLLARALFIVNPEPSMSFTFVRRIEPDYSDLSDAVVRVVNGHLGIEQHPGRPK
jgi:hypothetical protein